MSDYDENYVAGCYGTVAEQLDEAYYDDRSDADDDLEKGRIKFPKDKLYGRDKELAVLRQLYAEATMQNDNDLDCGEDGNGEARPRVSFASSNDSQIVFLSGYSGIGKSALVREFVNQIQQENKSSAKDGSSPPILHFSGKYVQQSGGAVPFSAISEVFGNMVSSLMKDQKRRRSSGDGDSESGAHDTHNTRLLCSRIWGQIQSSELIGPGAHGNEVLSDIFPSLRPLLDGRCVSNNKIHRVDSLANLERGGEPSMNAIKESTCELLNVVTSSLEKPLVLFLDDLQWADGPSIELLSFLFENTQIKNLLFICAYRSNEVSEDHPFANVMTQVTESRGQSIAKIDVFSLSQEAVGQFIADSIGVDEVDGVTELVDVIYPKTIGNIFCVKQAIEELVRKNALYYDVMCFEWRWTVDKVQLANQVSADVVETITQKIKTFSVDMQNLLAVMAYIPCSVDVSVLKQLLTSEVSDNYIAALLKGARDEGMLVFSVDKGHYILAHDKIREACRDFPSEEDRNASLLHMAHVLQRMGKSSKMEWCLYTAGDFLNSLPLEMVNVTDLIKLNLRVSKIAKKRGSPGKENMLLQKSADLLQPFKWKDYHLSLEVFNALIVSEFTLGDQEKATTAINEVLDNAKCLLHKSSAFLYRVRSLCETENYEVASHEGVRVLNMFSYNISLKPTKLHVAKEKARLGLSLSGRSYASLIHLPIKEDPLSELFSEVCRDCLFSGQQRLLLVVAWTAIRRAIEIGYDRFFPPTLAILGTLLGKKGDVIAANEIGNVALSLSENFRTYKAEYAFNQFVVHAGIIFYLQPFRSGVEVLQECHKELKFSGKFDLALGSMLNYMNAYFAAGLSLGPILESKLLVLDEFCQGIDRGGFAATFQIHRQFLINLRQRSENPTILNGPAFQQEAALDDMTDQASKMKLRDASVFRLQLAFVFNDTECMESMLEILLGYPFEDQVVSRFFIRACFTGLAAFSVTNKKYSELGNKCLNYFRRMKKLGSTNAPPAYYFITALKKPTHKAFMKAIDSCSEASMPHLEAMARERFSMFLRKRNELELANTYISSAYWLYYEWGAHGKSALLEREYPFLKEAKRSKVGSHETSSRSGTGPTLPLTPTRTSANGSVLFSGGVFKRQGTFEFNSTLRMRRFVKNKK